LGILLGRADQTGVEVERVYPDGPADRAGLREGDVVTRIHNQDVSEPQDVAQAIENLEPYEHVRISIERDGEQRTLTATLGSRRKFMSDRRAEDERFAGRYGEPHGRFFDEPMMPPSHRQLQEQNERIERMLRELTREVQQLRQEVQRNQQRQ
jgi:predicted metalloprotease with PDZ domain